VGYSIELADRIRKYLQAIPKIKVEEKKMFSGLAFLVNGKMCVNVSGEDLMCRYDPSLKNEVSMKVGFEPMIMKGREYQGYCYVSKPGYRSNADFEYWLALCLNFNKKAKATKRKKPATK
jgi:hypothetical protein